MAGTAPHPLLAMLTGGDRRSVRGVAAAIARVRRAPRLLRVLVDGLTHDDPLVRMRAADALEKLSAERPACLAPHARRLAALARTAEQAELRWHLAQMLPRVAWPVRERRELFRVVESWLADPSRIVQAMTLQALVELAGADATLRPRAFRHVEELERTGAPAVRARARLLLRQSDAPAIIAPGRVVRRKPSPRSSR